MSSEPVGLDRRRRRRLETIEEALDVAEAIMAEQGVAGLSAGEVARRMGIRPPSLYVYFPSKNALYDALFERGARGFLAAADEAEQAASPDAPLAEALLAGARLLVRWSVEHPAYSQLLFWRPVPGYAPSPEAYAPAVETTDRGRRWFASLQERGLLRPDRDVDDVLRDWTCVIAGVTSQQLSNAPDERFDEGRFVAALPALVEMFARHHGAPDA